MYLLLPINTHHLILSNFHLESDVQSYIFIYPSCEFYMSWFVASNQFRQLSMLWWRHKVKAGLHCTDEAQNKAGTRACSYLAPCKNYFFIYVYIMILKMRIKWKELSGALWCRCSFFKGATTWIYCHRSMTKLPLRKHQSFDPTALLLLLLRRAPRALEDGPRREEPALSRSWSSGLRVGAKDYQWCVTGRHRNSGVSAVHVLVFVDDPCTVGA